MRLALFWIGTLIVVPVALLALARPTPAPLAPQAVTTRVLPDQPLPAPALRVAASEPPPALQLFDDSTPDARKWPEAEPVLFRSRAVRIPPELLHPNRLQPGARLQLDLFPGDPDSTVTAVLQTVSTDANGVLSARGRLEGTQYSTLTLTAKNGAVLACVNHMDTHRLFEVCYRAAEQIHYVLELDLKNSPRRHYLPPVELDEDPNALRPHAAARSFTPQARATGTNVDVLMLYDNSAVQWANSRGGIDVVLAQAVNKLNQAIANTEVQLTVNLLHSEQVDHTYEGEGLLNDLDALISKSDGIFDNAHTLRDQYGADLVTLLVDTGSEFGNVGIANLLGSANGNANAAFSVFAVRAVNSSEVMSHEIMHNFGCGHSKFQVAQPGPGLLPAAAGWYLRAGDNVDYHTIMAYDEDGHGNFFFELSYFSSPTLTFKGAALGDAADGDNRACIMTVMDRIAAYRTSKPDLVVKSITQSPALPLPREKVSFSVTVENAGSADLVNVSVGFYPNQPLAPLAKASTIFTGTIATLPGRTSTTLSFSVTAPDTVNTPLRAWAFVDSAAKIVESNELNNAGPANGHIWQIQAPPAPVLASAVTATPNPAVVHQKVSFSVGVSTQPDYNLKYVWDFGTGSSLESGATTTFAYNAPGIYAISVTAIDPFGGAVTSSSSVSVTSGFVNLPFGSTVVATDLKRKLRLSFLAPAKDALDVTLAAPALVLADKAAFALQATDAAVDVYIGLDKIDALKLSSKGSGVGIAPHNGKFTWSGKAGTLRYAGVNSFQSLLAPFGAENATIQKPLLVPVSFVVNGVTYAAEVRFSYSAKAGKTAAGK